MSLVERLTKSFSKPSLTKQSFKDECDINKTMQRFKKVVGADYLAKYNGFSSGQFGDFSTVTDYRSALDQVRQAGEVFDALPAIVRRKFGNAASFLDFVHDPKNADELVSLGLATKRPDTQIPASAPVVQPAKVG